MSSDCRSPEACINVQSECIPHLLKHYVGDDALQRARQRHSFSLSSLSPLLHYQHTHHHSDMLIDGTHYPIEFSYDLMPTCDIKIQANLPFSSSSIPHFIASVFPSITLRTTHLRSHFPSVPYQSLSTYVTYESGHIKYMQSLDKKYITQNTFAGFDASFTFQPGYLSPAILGTTFIYHPSGKWGTRADGSGPALTIPHVDGESHVVTHVSTDLRLPTHPISCMFAYTQYLRSWIPASYQAAVTAGVATEWGAQRVGVQRGYRLLDRTPWYSRFTSRLPPHTAVSIGARARLTESCDVQCEGHIDPVAASLTASTGLYLLGPHAHAHGTSSTSTPTLRRTSGLHLTYQASRAHSNGDMTYAAGLSFVTS